MATCSMAGPCPVIAETTQSRVPSARLGAIRQLVRHEHRDPAQQRSPLAPIACAGLRQILVECDIALSLSVATA